MKTTELDSTLEGSSLHRLVGPLCLGCASLYGLSRRFDSQPLEPTLGHMDCTSGVGPLDHFGQVWPISHYERPNDQTEPTP